MKARAARKHDVIIVGGGPAGAVSALYLLKAGRDTHWCKLQYTHAPWRWLEALSQRVYEQQQNSPNCD
jgi:2-polyprenyl-6-methoxyphenol hydroxylase-like FAD-dependent oxidoreductase